MKKWILFIFIWTICIGIKEFCILNIDWSFIIIGIPTIYFNGWIIIENKIWEFQSRRKEKNNRKIQLLEPTVEKKSKEWNQEKCREIIIQNNHIKSLERLIDQCNDKEILDF